MFAFLFMASKCEASNESCAKLYADHSIQINSSKTNSREQEPLQHEENSKGEKAPSEKETKTEKDSDDDIHIRSVIASMSDIINLFNRIKREQSFWIDINQNPNSPPPELV